MYQASAVRNSGSRFRLGSEGQALRAGGGISPLTNKGGEMRRLITLLIGLLAIAALAAVSATSASAKPRGLNGKILINRADNLATGEEQTFTVNPDGSDFNLLVNNSERGRWSADGSRITVGTDVLGQAIFDFDTGVLASLNLGAQYPDLFLPCGVWSPNDKRLACEGFGITDPSLNGIYTVRSSDGGDLQRVTSDPGGDDCPSDFSPSGNRIVFTRANETTFALYTVRPDGTDLRQISPAGLNVNLCNGSWSPQGNEIPALGPPAELRLPQLDLGAPRQRHRPAPDPGARSWRAERRPERSWLSQPKLVTGRKEDRLQPSGRYRAARHLHRQRRRERALQRHEHPRHQRVQRGLGYAPGYAVREHSAPCVASTGQQRRASRLAARPSYEVSLRASSGKQT